MSRTSHFVGEQEVVYFLVQLEDLRRVAAPRLVNKEEVEVHIGYTQEVQPQIRHKRGEAANISVSKD